MLAAPALAAAQPIPGATYTGTADGGNFSFTVSSDGTLVQSYAVDAAHGTAANGSGCLFNAAGDSAVWSGAPITNDAFSYVLGTALVFEGAFTGSQSASGTFRFSDPANAATAGCDTGVISWTATTTAHPPAGSSGSGGGGSGAGPAPSPSPSPSTGSGSGGGSSSSGASQSTGSTGASGGASKARRSSVATRVTFAKLSGKKLGGRLRSSETACVAGRFVYLWRRNKRVGRTRASKRGVYAFRLPRSMRGRAVRASVAVLAAGRFSCAAGSSTFIRA